MKLFTCAGCEISTLFSAVCAHCQKSIRWNKVLLPSPTSGIESIAPLFYSLGTTHRIFKQWKSRPGLLLQKSLFRVEPMLLEELCSLKVDCVTFIPQNFERSWERGQASAQVAAYFFAEILQVDLRPLLILREEGEQKVHTQQGTLQSIDRDFSPNFFNLQEYPHPSSRILMVDDLITTGNTLARAAELLHHHDSSLKIFGASLAYRPRKMTAEVSYFYGQKRSTMGEPTKDHP